MAVAKITRTVTHTTAIVKAVQRDTLEGVNIRIPLGEYVTAEDKILKLAQKYMQKNLSDYVLVNVMDVEHSATKYSMDLNMFLELATPVEE